MKKNKILILIILITISVIGIFKIEKFKNNKKEEEVVFNLGSDFNTLDPHLFTEMISVQVDSTIYEGLLTLDKDGKYIGGVAESFTENGNKLVFKIRESAKWSDGSKISAKDFVFAFKRVLDPKVAAQFSEMLFPIKNAENYYNGKVTSDDLGIKAIDDKTLEIELEYPTAYFKYILTLPISVPLKEEFYKIGISYNFYTSADIFRISLSGLEENISKGLGLMKHWLTSVKPDSEVYEGTVELILESREVGKKDKNKIMAANLQN